MRIEIKCPKCKWKPNSEKLWQCTCNHIWNTFETGGICPKCKKNGKTLVVQNVINGVSILRGIVIWIPFLRKN
jgi:hypothetical protein